MYIKHYPLTCFSILLSFTWYSCAQLAHSLQEEGFRLVTQPFTHFLHFLVCRKQTTRCSIFDRPKEMIESARSGLQAWCSGASKQSVNGFQGLTGRMWECIFMPKENVLLHQTSAFGANCWFLNLGQKSTVPYTVVRTPPFLLVSQNTVSITFCRRRLSLEFPR